MSKAGSGQPGGFRPYMKGPRKTPPGLHEALVNYPVVEARQQRALVEAAGQILRRGAALDFDSLRAADASLRMADLTPLKLQDAATALRQRRHVLPPQVSVDTVADALDLLGGIAPEVIARRQAERRHGEIARLLRPLDYRFEPRADLPPCWLRRRTDGSEILIFPQQADSACTDAAWTAVAFDEHSNRIADSGAALPLQQLLDRLPFLPRTKPTEV